MRYLLAALVLVLASCGAPKAREPVAGEGTLFLASFNSLTEADRAAGSAALTAAGATLADGKWGTGLLVTPGQSVAISSAGNLLPRQGTLMFWFKPNWSTAAKQASHALLSWGWDDGKDGYCVLSDGWWEPAGAGRTYLVFENQLYAHTSLPITYTKGEWMHFAITWSFGKQLLASLHLNGHRIATAVSHRPFTAPPKLRTPIFLGSDKGSASAAGRSADGVFDAVHILDRALEPEQVRDTFRAQAANWRQLERTRQAWLLDVLEQPYRPQRDTRGRILESRALLDEWHRWATREGAEKYIDKLVRAGFNVYIPCIWHGRGVTWPSKLAPMADAVKKMIADEPEGFDPLANLIRVAHARGVEVHPWFCVCYRDPRWKFLGQFAEEGTPKGACEAHNPKFRKFIVDLMMEVVRKYGVDGINLDYIRTKGVSTSATAKASFKKRFGVELLDEMKKREPNGWPNAKVVQWQNEAIADIVRSFAEQARAVRPKLVISVDGHPSPPGSMPGTQGRDGFRWAQEGWIDVLYSMDYGRKLTWERADAVRAAFKRPAASVIIVGNYERSKKGGVESREGKLVADLIAFCQRKYPGNGVALYWMGSLDEAQSKALRAGPFRKRAIPHWIRATDPQPIE